MRGQAGRTEPASLRAGPALPVAAAMAAVFVVAFAAALGGLGIGSTFNGRAAVDEPQYLLTALSLFEDGDLDIDDELDDRRWSSYHDTDLPVQTEELPDGRQLSPHDPLLPLVLAVPVGLGGLAAAKATMAVLAGLAAASTLWVGVRRFGVALAVATPGVALAFASPPLAVYGQQVYPELPAALAVVLAVGALAGPLGRGGLAGFGVAVTALPWLSVKYAPVGAALALVALTLLLRAGRRAAAGVLAGVLGLAGVAYLLAHKAIWGGWTVYAAGDHFQETGEFAVVGSSPDYLSRAQRLAALLLDHDYGLLAWQPAWVLVVPALGAALAVRRPGGRLAALVLPAVAGWLVATFLALTMNGHWFPGRQVVVVLPLLVLLVLWFLDRMPVPVRLVGAALGLVGVVALVALLVDGHGGEISWVSVARTRELDDPLHHSYAGLLPDYRAPGNVGVWPRHYAWLGVFAVLAAAAWVHARRSRASATAP